MMNHRQTPDQTAPPVRCVEAEAGLLGAALLAPQSARNLLDGLSDDDWTEPAHAAVYVVVRTFLDSAQYPEPVAVLAALRRIDRPLDRDPGVLLADLMDAVITPAAGPTYRAIVREHTWRRTVTEIAARLDHAARSADREVIRSVIDEAVTILRPRTTVRSAA